MADEGTAGTLVLVAAILQLIFFISFFAIGAITFLGLALIDPLLAMLMIVFVAIYFVFGIFGFIFMILWFMWRSDPCSHKTGLIITGIFGLILAGFLPGLLVLIAGIICPSESA